MPLVIREIIEDCMLAIVEHYRCLMTMNIYRFLYTRYYTAQFRLTPYAGSVPPHDLPNFDRIFRPFPGAPVAVMKIGTVAMNECLPVRNHCAYQPDHTKPVPFLPGTYYPGVLVEKMTRQEGVVIGQHTDIDHLHVHLGGDLITNKCIVWRTMY